MNQQEEQQPYKPKGGIYQSGRRGGTSPTEVTLRVPEIQRI